LAADVRTNPGFVLFSARLCQFSRKQPANPPQEVGTMRFENQAVLVSGAGRGIGKEIALSFAREGADIGFAEVNEETASATANEIRKLRRWVFFSRTDVSDYDQVQQFYRGSGTRVRPNRRADQQRGHR
jgi:FlaA1/EpsC-like NDP-sugar epimerase